MNVVFPVYPVFLLFSANPVNTVTPVNTVFPVNAVFSVMQSKLHLEAPITDVIEEMTKVQATNRPLLSTAVIQ